MLWIDIGMTVLLTLRMALSRRVMSRLVDPDNDVSLPEEKDDIRSASS
jgi:hypothetical protein